jgi:hypothetical protein
MPRLVADQRPWHFSAATVCVGPGEYPRALEWELRSGTALADLTPLPGWAINYSHQTKRARETGLALIATPVSFVRKFGAEKPKSPPSVATRRRYITSERANNSWNIRPRLKSTKNWSFDSHRSSRLRFEWKASGLTVVSFWTVPKPSGLEGQVRFNFGWTLPGPIESE